MAGKIVSIKIGYSITHVAEVEHESKTPKIYHAFAFETPDDVLNDDGVHVTDEFVRRMKQGMTENGIQTNRIMFTISSTRVANREVTIPLVKENKIRPILMANAKDYFPVDLALYQLVYRVIETMKAEKQMRVSIYAVPNSLISSYQLLAKAMDMQLVSLDYYGNSIYEAMMNTMSPELSATLCIDDNSSMLTVIQNSQIVLQRSIGYGIDDAVFAMMQTPLVSRDATYMDALAVMQMNPSFSEQLHPERMNDELSTTSAKDSISQALSMLIGNISRVLDYFSSRHSDVELPSLTLLGMGASCRGLDILLSNELGVRVTPVSVFGSADAVRDLSAKKFNIGEYYINIACALKPLNFILVSDDKKKKGAEGSKDSILVPGLIFTLCLIVSAAVVGYMVVGNLALAADNTNKERSIASKSNVIDSYNSYLTSKVINDGIHMIDKNSNVPNEAFLELLKELETEMPSDMLVSALSVSGDTISITATCNSKNSAAEILEQLRLFGIVYNLDCSGIAEEENDNGVKKVNLSVAMMYTGTQAEEDETEDGLLEAGGEASESTQSTENAQ